MRKESFEILGKSGYNPNHFDNMEMAHRMIWDIINAVCHEKGICERTDLYHFIPDYLRCYCAIFNVHMLDLILEYMEVLGLIRLYDYRYRNGKYILQGFRTGKKPITTHEELMADMRRVRQKNFCRLMNDWKAKRGAAARA